MKKDILHFLEFPAKNELYSSMAKNSLDILMNMELLFKNKLNLDKAYHEPDNFLIECNNIIRNILFIIMKAKTNKQKYPWLYNFILNYIEEHDDDCLVLNKLRDNSMHQELIIAEGAIQFGLYKIMDQISYKLKIGMGDANKERSLPLHYIYKETESYFQQILISHYFLFMDLEHTAIGECLGVTRWWLYDVKYKNKSQEIIKKPIDIYNIISITVDSIINGISSAYSEYSNIPHENWKIHIPDKYNFINTILEIDLYPNIFKDKWNYDAKPLNWKYLLEDNIIQETKNRHTQIGKVYSFIPKSKHEIINLLDRYSTIKTQDFIDQDDYDKYMSLILLPHYFLDSIKSVNLITNLDFSLIMELNDIGQDYAYSINPNFDSIADEIKDEYFKKIGVILNKIRTSLTIE